MYLILKKIHLVHLKTIIFIAIYFYNYIWSLSPICLPGGVEKDYHT